MHRTRTFDLHPPALFQYLGPFPHCDPRILHAPGECEVCDEVPVWQELRFSWGIAFTGYEPDKNELPDPATNARGEEVNTWDGNKPQPPCEKEETKPGPYYSPELTATLKANTRIIGGLSLNGRATDHIWLMEDGPGSHPIGVRMDCGDSGVVYMSRNQAADLASQLLDLSDRPQESGASGVIDGFKHFTRHAKGLKS